MVSIRDRFFNAAVILQAQPGPLPEEPVAAIAWSAEGLEVYAPPNRSAIESALRLHFKALATFAVEEAIEAFATASHPYRVVQVGPLLATSMEHAARTALHT